MQLNLEPPDYHYFLRGADGASALVNEQRLLGSFIVAPDALVGPIGDGAKSNDEVAAPFFLVCSSACWNGICLAAMDITKNHTTRKVHNDVGMRVADNPTIQDYVGECLIDTNNDLTDGFRTRRASGL